LIQTGSQVDVQRNSSMIIMKMAPMIGPRKVPVPPIMTSLQKECLVCSEDDFRIDKGRIPGIGRSEESREKGALVRRLPFCFY